MSNMTQHLSEQWQWFDANLRRTNQLATDHSGWAHQSRSAEAIWTNEGQAVA